MASGLFRTARRVLTMADCCTEDFVLDSRIDVKSVACVETNACQFGIDEVIFVTVLHQCSKTERVVAAVVNLFEMGQSWSLGIRSNSD